MLQTEEVISISTRIDSTGFNKGLESMKSTAESAVKAITQILNSSDGAVKNLGDCIVNMNKKIINAMSESTDSTNLFIRSLDGINSAINVFDFASNSVLPMIQAFQEAQLQVKLFKASNTEASVAQAALNGTVSAGQIVVGLLTGEIGLATAATALWNAACLALGGPIGVAVVTIGALAAGFIALAGAFSNASEHDKFMQAHEEKMESINKSIDTTKEERKAMEERQAVQDKKLSTDLAEIKNTEQLAKELSGLVDANGRVKEGYQGRVDFILDNLNAAMGTEYKLIDGVIGGYDKLAVSIDNSVAQMKAGAIIESQREAYTQAVTNIDRASLEVEDAYQRMNDNAEKNQILIDEKTKLIAAAKSAGLELTVTQLENEIKYLDDENLAYKDNYQQKLDNLNEHLTNKQLLEDNEAAIREGRFEDVKTKEMAALQDKNSSVLSEMDANYKVLSGQRLAFEDAENEARAAETQKKMDELVEEGIAKAAQQGINNEQDLAVLGEFISIKQQRADELKEYLKTNVDEQAQAELDSINEQINTGLPAYQSFLSSKKQSLEENGNALLERANQFKDGNIQLNQEEQSTLLSQLAEYQKDRQAYANMLETNMASSNGRITQDMVDEANKQVALAYVAMQKVGGNLGDGLSDGAEDKNKNVKDSADDLGKKLVEGAEVEKDRIPAIGEYYGDGFISGLSSRNKLAYNAGFSLGLQAKIGIKAAGVVSSPSKVMRKEVGEMYGEGFVLGIKDKQADTFKAAEGVGKSALKGALLYRNKMLEAFNYDTALTKSLKSIDSAILSEQLKMASVVQTQSKIEMLKTNILKAETQSIYGKVDALIENHVDLDGRELAVALAPMISEELAFNWR